MVAPNRVRFRKVLETMQNPNCQMTLRGVHNFGFVPETLGFGETVQFPYICYTKTPFSRVDATTKRKPPRRLAPSKPILTTPLAPPSRRRPRTVKTVIMLGDPNYIGKCMGVHISSRTTTQPRVRHPTPLAEQRIWVTS